VDLSIRKSTIDSLYFWLSSVAAAPWQISFMGLHICALNGNSFIQIYIFVHALLVLISSVLP